LGGNLKTVITADVTLKVQFYDLDPMEVVWHGNYVRYLEQARCALLDRIGYNYVEMSESGFVWPVVDLRVKYVRAIRFAQEIKIRAELTEYENRLRIDYRITDAATGETLTKAQTTQVAVNAATQELCLESPAAFQAKVKAHL
jgi:acyl-CoA thioester hydrolase